MLSNMLATKSWNFLAALLAFLAELSISICSLVDQNSL